MSASLDKSLAGIFPDSVTNWENLFKNYLLLSVVTVVVVTLADPTNTVFQGLKTVMTETLPYTVIAWTLVQKSKKDLYAKILRLLVLSGGATFVAYVVKPNNNTGVEKIIDICQTVGLGLFQGSLLSIAFVL